LIAGAAVGATKPGSGPVKPLPPAAQAVSAGDTLRDYPPLQREDLPMMKVDRPFFWSPPARLNARRVAPPILTVPAAHDSGAQAAMVWRSADGYRVQLYAGREQGVARKVETAAKESLNLPVYLLYEAPQYKVRIGNFATREEAAQICSRLRREGFPDAWVVRSTVTLQK
jgi:hypothetical protein